MSTDNNQQSKTGENKPLVMGRAVSVALLRANSALVVKCIPGSKKPVKGWDPAKNNLDSSTEVLSGLEYTNDNFGIHLHNEWVDVDVDTKDPFMYAALDAYLPHCPHTWGRASKPRSHRLYKVSEGSFDPSKHHFLRLLARIPSVNVELRGGAVSRAEYSIMPGSMHDEGELYEWDNVAAARGSTISVVPTNSIVHGLRKAAVATLMAQHWTEGVRQELTMALAGFLQRIHNLTWTWAESSGAFCMGYAEALDWFKKFLEVVDDDRSDRRDRIAAFTMTWEKGEEGKKVTGATRIAEVSGDKAIMRTLYSLLSESPDMQRLDAFLERYAIRYGTGDLIDIESSRAGGLVMMTRIQASNSMGHEWFSSGNGKPVKMVDYLYGLPNTTRVSGISFMPGMGQLIDEPSGGCRMNAWCGFDFDPVKQPVDAKDVEIFLDYMKTVVANNDKGAFEWALAWVADIFKDPAKKPGTALVLVSKPGSGKSFLGDTIRSIIGRRHSVQLSDLERLVSKHNDHIANRLFIQCDEASNSKQRGMAARLKSFITDPTMLVEPKFVGAYETENHSRVMMTSNDKRDAIALPDGSDDRRYTILETSEDMRTNLAYWRRLREWTDANLATLHKFFVSHNYEKQLIRRPYVTMAKHIMSSSSWSAFDAWVIRSLSTAFPLGVSDHHYPADAHSGTVSDTTLDRSVWPKYVSLDALLRTVNRNGTVGVTFNPNTLLRELSMNGLAAPKLMVMKVKEFDQRLGFNREMNTSYVEIADRAKFERYAKEKLGLTSDHEHMQVKATEGDY